MFNSVSSLCCLFDPCSYSVVLTSMWSPAKTQLSTSKCGTQRSFIVSLFTKSWINQLYCLHRENDNTKYKCIEKHSILKIE